MIYHVTDPKRKKFVMKKRVDNSFQIMKRGDNITYKGRCFEIVRNKPGDVRLKLIYDTLLFTRSAAETHHFSIDVNLLEECNGVVVSELTLDEILILNAEAKKDLEVTIFPVVVFLCIFSFGVILSIVEKNPYLIPAFTAFGIPLTLQISRSDRK